jgi:hypothetical protein
MSLGTTLSLDVCAVLMFDPMFGRCSVETRNKLGVVPNGGREEIAFMNCWLVPPNFAKLIENESYISLIHFYSPLGLSLFKAYIYSNCNVCLRSGNKFS